MARPESAVVPTISLADLGLQQGLLLEAVRASEIARGNCSSHHPPTYPGFVAWGEAVRVLREHLLPLGWIANNDDNFPVVISHDRKFAIAVVTGDQGTGRPHADVATRSVKGSKTAAVVAENAQLNMFQLLGIDKPSEFKDEAPVATWMLLIHRTENEIRSELALPSIVDDSGRIVGWKHRIMLPPISRSPEPDRKSVELSPEIDIQIQRRQ